MVAARSRDRRWWPSRVGGAIRRRAARVESVIVQKRMSDRGRVVPSAIADAVESQFDHRASMGRRVDTIIQCVARAVWSRCTDSTHRRETASCACTQKLRRHRTPQFTCMYMNPYCHMYRYVLHTIAVGCDAAMRRRIRAQQRSGSSVVACPYMDRSVPRISFIRVRSHVNRSYSRSVRALVDIQDIRYPSGHIPRRSGRMPNGYPRFRLRNVELPSPPDTDSDSDETLRHKTMHRVLATRVIRRLKRNAWAKQNWRRLLYLLCWALKAKHVSREHITDIARWIGKWTVIEDATAVQRTVFAHPFREWQSWKVRYLERRYGPYPLRTCSRPSQSQ